MSEERGRLQGEKEKARIEIESLRQTKQQVETENASLLERLGTLEEHQVRTQTLPQRHIEDMVF